MVLGTGHMQSRLRASVKRRRKRRKTKAPAPLSPYPAKVRRAEKKKLY